MSNIKNLRRLRHGVVAGVCGGIAKYFEVDVVLIRILWVIFALSGGVGILAYIACVILMPSE